MANKMQDWLKAVFFALMIIFILLVGFFVFPFEDPVRRILFPVAGILALIFLILGIALIYLTFKSKIKGKLKVFLLMTGFSSAGFLVSVILHNLFYALGIVFEDIIILKYIMEALHVIFFLLGIPVSPIVFLIGAVGGVVLFLRR